MIVKTFVEADDISSTIAETFDYELTAELKTNIPDIPALPSAYSLGLLVGSSGSGKSNLLKQFGLGAKVEWDDNRAVVSHFHNVDEGIQRLTGVGLNTIPTWLQPFHTLSTGEQYRANLARALKNRSVIDEFTSVVDRNTARSLAFSLQRYVRQHDLKNVVLATPHRDITNWLMPDWIYDTDTFELSYPNRARPKIEIELVLLGKQDKLSTWQRFSKHHYLSGKLNTAARCYSVTWQAQAIGFTLAFRA